MERLFLIFSLLVMGNCLGQVGINTTNPKAMLQINKLLDSGGNVDTKSGILLPKLDESELIALETAINSLSHNDRIELDGLMFYVEDIEDIGRESELWVCKIIFDDTGGSVTVTSTAKLQPVHRKPKTFINAYLDASAANSALSTEVSLPFSIEIFDKNNELDQFGATALDPYIFIPKTSGLFRIYLQYHTVQGSGTGNYGLNIYKTLMGDIYPDDRSLVATTTYSSTGGDAANTVYRSLSTLLELQKGDVIDFTWESTFVVIGGLQTDQFATYLTIEQLKVAE